MESPIYWCLCLGFMVVLAKGEDAVVVECEKGWHLYKDQCYWIQSEYTTRDAAVRSCTDLGSYLAHILPKDEIKRYLPRYLPKGFWAENRYWTSLIQMQGKHYWGDMHYPSGSNCYQLTESGRLLKWKCDDTAGSICQKDAQPKTPAVLTSTASTRPTTTTTLTTAATPTTTVATTTNPASTIAIPTPTTTTSTTSTATQTTPTTNSYSKTTQPTHTTPNLVQTTKSPQSGAVTTPGITVEDIFTTTEQTLSHNTTQNATAGEDHQQTTYGQNTFGETSDNSSQTTASLSDTDQVVIICACVAFLLALSAILVIVWYRRNSRKRRDDPVNPRDSASVRFYNNSVNGGPSVRLEPDETYSVARPDRDKPVETSDDPAGPEGVYIASGLPPEVAPFAGNYKEVVYATNECNENPLAEGCKEIDLSEREGKDDPLSKGCSEIDLLKRCGEIASVEAEGKENPCFVEYNNMTNSTDKNSSGNVNVEKYNEAYSTEKESNKDSYVGKYDNFNSTKKESNGNLYVGEDNEGFFTEGEGQNTNLYVNEVYGLETQASGGLSNDEEYVYSIPKSQPAFEVSSA